MGTGWCTYSEFTRPNPPPLLLPGPFTQVAFIPGMAGCVSSTSEEAEEAAAAAAQPAAAAATAAAGARRKRGKVASAAKAAACGRTSTVTRSIGFRTIELVQDVAPKVGCFCAQWAWAGCVRGSTRLNGVQVSWCRM